jgi:hypothetical protein
MASLDDIKAAGYDVAVAWEGDPDVYEISRQSSGDPGDQTAALSYLPDDPDLLDLLLHQPIQPTKGT